MFIKLNQARCHLHDYGGIYDVSSLGVYEEENRRQGHAKKIIRAIRKLSDRTNKPVFLVASPYSHSPIRGNNLPDLDRLIFFYTKMGFEPVGERKKYSQTMAYYPKRKRHEIHR